MSAPSAVGFGGRFGAPVLIGPALNPINTTMISVALVPIARATHTSASVVIWLVAGLYIVSSVFQPTMGKLADLFGPRRVYLAGLVIAGVGGLVPLLAPTFAGALVARLAIGIGTSSAYPAAMTIIRDQEKRLDRKAPQVLLSGLSISGLVTAAIGPVLGGLLLQHFTWQSIFLVNVPFAALTIVLTLLWLPSDRTRSGARGTVGVRSLDLPGMLLFAVGITSAVFFFLHLETRALWLVAVAVVALVGLVLWERGQQAPFVDVRMLASNHALTATYARLFLVYTGIYLVVYGFTQWAQAVAGYTSDAAGLLQLPSAVGAAVTSLAIARTPRVRGPLLVAATASVVGGVFLLFLDVGSPVWFLLVIMGLFGVAQGLSSVSNQAVLFRRAPAAQIGSASGLSRTSVQIGAIAASSILGPVFGDAPSDQGMHVIAIVVLALAAGALLVTVADRSLRRSVNEPSASL
ncbi:MFS transporter [Promicromonospora citrea]|uniref:MFS transporter n=1 Tax=Promicromonospora citrea TaxID=43677 RepID=A0A8H9GLZ6_9MICO|nr:MFS transporter [Promicromonospora citrea]NNH51803.1 MFS transporter [Promicromonospora citrea]GGM36185.1 MFS transporter [Promicromonospora citrea]